MTPLTKSTTVILRIAVVAPLTELFDYLPPSPPVTTALVPGLRVLVPFGRSQRIGMIVAVGGHTDLAADRLKPIDRVLDAQPLLSAADLTFLLWSATYYRGYPGEAVFSALPTRLRRADHVVAFPPEGGGDSSPAPAADIPPLNSAQLAAVTAMTQQRGFHCFLLDGVTGSGKTEVYLRLMVTALERGGQVLVLVPEIGLTPQLYQRFSARLTTDIAVMHSGLTDRERELAWWHVTSGRSRVLLGTRSAVFTPLPDLALVIVDEEHDMSLKQQDGWRYSARDLAVRRAQLANCPIVLGSATPALESLHNASVGRYQRLVLPHRAGAAQLPQIVLADMRQQRGRSGLSAPLITHMTRELAAGNQVLLFLNRRGFAPVLTCQQCNWISTCPHCDVRLTVHHQPLRLRCHHCGHSRAHPTQCPECASTDLRPLGQGTERIETQLQQLFPDYPLARIDRDSTRRRGELARQLAAAQRGDYSIVLGTQMLAKGHHLPGVTLVGILSVDHGLYGADFRATERMAQLLIQVAGRAGRAEQRGTVIVQTRHPDHPLLAALLQHGYGAFAADALTERAAAQLPPFSYQALLRAESKTPALALDFLQQAVAVAPPLGCGELWGPAPAPMARRAGQNRAQLLLQAPTRGAVQTILATWLPRVRELKPPRQVRWTVDVDPVEVV